MNFNLKKKTGYSLFSYKNYRRISLLLRGPASFLLWLGGVKKENRKQIQHFKGIIPELKEDPAGPHIWIHGASLGEAGISLALSEELIRTLDKKCHITLSCLTKTAHLFLKKNLPEESSVVFAPLDFPGWPERAIKRRKPDLMLIIETEIWPNWIFACHKVGVKVLMLNGRISERSFPGYIRIQGLLKEIFKKMEVFNMISEKDAQRIRRLGAPSEKINIYGNIKRDIKKLRDKKNLKLAESIREELGISEKKKIWVCGSIRKNEESILFEVFHKVQKKFPESCMILAPRHLNRLDFMEKACLKAGLEYQRRSLNQKLESPVLFLDTMGELKNFYGLADVVFCGGSLVNAGGQNPIEAAAWGKAIIFGPSMEDFTEEKKLLLDAGGAFQIHNKKALYEKILLLFSSPETAELMGEKSLKALLETEGALDKNLSSILEFIS